MLAGMMMSMKQGVGHIASRMAWSGVVGLPRSSRQLDVLKKSFSTVKAGLPMTMKALVCGELPGQVRVVDKAVPEPSDNSVVVAMVDSTYCGTDVSVNDWHVPSAMDAIKGGKHTLGHEGWGVVVKVGAEVQNWEEGDSALISCTSACGQCPACLKEEFGDCSDKDGGWRLGNDRDGTLAEFVNVDHADGTLWKLPEGVDPRLAVLTSDIFPTALDIGLHKGFVKTFDPQSLSETRFGILGGGPLGQATAMLALLGSSEVYVFDREPDRLAMAESLGAVPVNIDDEAAVQQYKETMDHVIEFVGRPEAVVLAQFLARDNLDGVGGDISIGGVHSANAPVNMERFWRRGMQFFSGTVHGGGRVDLFDLMVKGALDPSALYTHRLPFGKIDVEQAKSIVGDESVLDALLYEQEGDGTRRQRSGVEFGYNLFRNRIDGVMKVSLGIGDEKKIREMLAVELSQK